MKKVGKGYYSRTPNLYKSQPIRTGLQITQWHNIEDTPHNNGVYQCMKSNGQIVWARWLNSEWYCGYDIAWKKSFSFAAKSRDKSFLCSQYTHWRGITYV